MKKILFLLLSTIAGYGQVPADATPLENIQITNNVQDNAATKVTVQTSAGVQNWLPMVNLPVSTATQTAIDAKVGDFINDGATTIAPSMNAVYDALSLKQLVFTGIDQTQFLTENDIVFDNTALTLTIATVKNGTAISSGNPVVFYTDGNGVAIKHTKTAPVVFTFTNTTGVWYFYFDTSGNPIASQTAPSDSSTIARVYRIYWNSALAVEDKRVIESLEVYKNDATWVDRDWKDTQGAQYSSGFTISSNVLASGTPAIDGSNAVVNLTSGTIIDANLAYTLTNAATGTTKFTQNLGSGLLPATSGKFICITNNASLILDKIPATDFPFLWNATTNTPEYLTQLGVRTGVSANNFFVYYLYAIQDPRRGETIKIKSAEVDFANSSLAEAHTWTQLQTLFPTLRDSKIRVLYKLTFEYKTAFDVGTKKTALRKIEDLRKQRTTSTATVGGVIPASTVSFTPIGNISSSNVQLALEELDAEKASTLQGAYNNGSQITTTTALGAVTIKRGSAADTDNVFVGQNGAGTNTFMVNGAGKVSANGGFEVPTAGTNGFFGSDGASGMYQNTGNHLVFRSSQDGFQFEPRVYSGANAAGDIIKFKSGFEFSPTSGTGVFNVLNLTGTINQTGGANGITRGIYINPTLTSAANFRAIDVTAGTILAPSFTKVGGTSSQFLKADGSVDGNSYHTGTLTANYIPKATGANSLVNGQMIDNGTSVSITPSDSRLKGGDNAGRLIVSNATTTAYLELSGEASAVASDVALVTTTGNIGFFTNGTRKVSVSNSGNVLVGTSTDDGVNKLQVNGSVSATSYTGNATLTGTPTAPTAAAGTNTTQIATTAFVQSATRPYKVYTALITQTGTDAPTAIVLENTTGATVTFARTAIGTYNAQFSSAVLTVDKTVVPGSSTDTSDGIFNSGVASTTQVNFFTAKTSPYALTDDYLTKNYFEIRVYN